MAPADPSPDAIAPDRGRGPATPGWVAAELPGLPEMLAQIQAAPEIVRPSRFWDVQAEVQMQDLEHGGFGEFKRTLNRLYFQFRVVNPRDPQYRAVLRSWLRRPSGAPFAASLEEPLELPPARLPPWLRARLHGRSYALYMALLHEYVRRRDRLGVLERLDEPALGHPIVLPYRGHRVSEDLCNSALEYTGIVEALPGGLRPQSRVIELGPGYGRLAWVFLSLHPDVRYMLVDIPPALAVAQRYLSELFPERRTFCFRRFDQAADVAEELEQAQLAFLTPDQLALLPDQRASLFLNVSSLHEMRRDQIEHYFGLVARHTAGFFFTKQWLSSQNPFDGIVVGRGDYPVPASWRPVFDRVHPVQAHFFEALYEVGSSSPPT